MYIAFKGNELLDNFLAGLVYSHSIVAGGLEEMS